MKKRRVVMGLMIAAAGAVAGCSSLDLGPSPTTYVGPSAQGPSPLTDPGLNAVAPMLAAPAAGAIVQMPGTAPASDLPGQGVSPQTMPAATQPTTTQPSAATNPATHPAVGQGSTAENALGRMAVPQELTVQQAILLGLRNNVNLRVQQLSIPINRTREESARAAFDPTVTGSANGTRSGTSSTGKFGGTQTGYTDDFDASVGISDYLPTGTTLSGRYDTNNTFDSSPSANGGGTVTITQALLQGADINANLARLREAELDTKISQFQVRAIAEDLVASIEETYWTVAYDERQVLIVQNALDVAEAQLAQTRSLINVGRVAPTEQAASVAQVELEKEDLINAKSALEKDRLSLLRLLTPAGQPFWNRTITLETQPFIPVGRMDPVNTHVRVGLEYRPEVNQTKLQIQQNDLEVVRTKNGLLPVLNLIASLGKTGYSSSFAEANANINGPDYTARIGVSGSWDPVNRAEYAAFHGAKLTRERSEEALDDLYQTIQVDVRSQYIEVQRTRQQIDATRATREANETSLEVETAKFKAGRSTSLLVAQAQQNLLSSQLSEVQAVTNHLNALVELYRLEGSLLYRRGIAAPGEKPITGPAWH